ncbi:MAG: extracellular solute-binding protein [Ruminococcus sp.]|nr:extracellular solute-binding protein [Ruminococcus sp.]
MKNSRKLVLTIASALLVSCVSGCENSGSELPLGACQNEILTLSPVAQEKELVTIHYEYGLDIYKQIEAAIEKKFPDVEIVMVHDGANDSNHMLRQSLVNGMEMDIIFARYFQQMNDIVPQYMMDLSGEDFINNFYLTSLDNCTTPDGELYYLPGPSDVHGIIYNKTMFEENGWEVPHSYTEFVELIKTIDGTGKKVTEEIDGEAHEVMLRGIRPSIYFADSFQIIFNTFAYDAVLRGVENRIWLNEYQNGKESMKGHMEPYAETIKKLLNDGVVRLEDWDFMPRHRMPVLCNYHSAAMIIGPQNTYSIFPTLKSDNEYAMMPLWTSDEPDSDYLYAMPNYFYGISKTAAEKSPERRKLLLDILAYINDPMAQEEILGEGKAYVSNLKDVRMSENPFFDDVRHTIESGRIINNFSFAEGNDTREVERRMNETVRDMLTGKITVDEWFTIIDKARDDYLSGKSTYVPEVYGTCEEEFSKLDTALLIGQIYRDAADADIGLVFVNTTEQGANCRIYKGNIDAAVMRHMAPDRTSGEGEGVAYAMLKGQQIIDCLNGLEEFPGQFNVCYYVASGLDVEFAPWMPVGSRLISCKLPDGTPIDPEKSYKTAFFSDKLYYNVDGEFAVYRPEDMQLAEGKWHDIFIKWIADHNNVLKRPEQTTILNWKTLQ